MGQTRGMGDDPSLSRLLVGEIMIEALIISQQDNPDLSRAVQVEQCGCGIEVSISGYGRPIYLELDKLGEPALYITAEADSDDVSHTISLAGAKEIPDPTEQPATGE